MTRAKRKTKGNLDVQAVTSNLIKFYIENVTELDKIEGKNWYKSANEFCELVGERYGIDTFIVASVVSALSPHNRWLRNMIDAENLISAFVNGKNLTLVKVSTFGQNKKKAIEILKSNSGIVRKVTNSKTFSFVHNIAYKNSPYVTIDGHAKNAADGIRQPLTRGKCISAKDYLLYQDGYKLAANYFGYKYAYQFQAVIWVTWKRVNNFY